MLVAAANPCPCGRGEADPECSCAPLAVRRYQARLSGALADRIDVLAAIRQPSAEELAALPVRPPPPSANGSAPRASGRNTGSAPDAATPR